MTEITLAARAGRHWKQYYELCKPKVVLLIVFTAIVGMLLSTPGLIPWHALVFGTLGIGLAAAFMSLLTWLLLLRMSCTTSRMRQTSPSSRMVAPLNGPPECRSRRAA